MYSILLRAVTSTWHYVYYVIVSVMSPRLVHAVNHASG